MAALVVCPPPRASPPTVIPAEGGIQSGSARPMDVARSLGSLACPVTPTLSPGRGGRSGATPPSPRHSGESRNPVRGIPANGRGAQPRKSGVPLTPTLSPRERGPERRNGTPRAFRRVRPSFRRPPVIPATPRHSGESRNPVRVSPANGRAARPRGSGVPPHPPSPPGERGPERRNTTLSPSLRRKPESSPGQPGHGAWRASSGVWRAPSPPPSPPGEGAGSAQRTAEGVPPTPPVIPAEAGIQSGSSRRQCPR